MIPVFFRCAVVCACLLVNGLRLSAQTIVDGVMILRQGGQVPCKMIRASKRKEEEVQVYSQVQVIDSAGTRTYLPAELLGYVKDGVAYKAFNDNGQALFARCLVEGRSTLFYHPGGYGAGETRHGKRYFFKKEGESGFMSINAMAPSPKWIGVPENPPPGGNPNSNRLPTMPIKAKDTRFIDFFSDYLKDCQGVVRKIKMEFYTISDMKSIFEDFNACK